MKSKNVEDKVIYVMTVGAACYISTAIQYVPAEFIYPLKRPCDQFPKEEPLPPFLVKCVHIAAFWKTDPSIARGSFIQ